MDTPGRNCQRLIRKSISWSLRGLGDKASTCYSNLIHKFKKKRHLARPDCVPEEGWGRWLEYWNMLDVMAKSDQQRQNKMSELGGLGKGCLAIPEGLARSLSTLTLWKNSMGAHLQHMRFSHTHIQRRIASLWT